MQVQPVPRLQVKQFAHGRGEHEATLPTEYHHGIHEWIVPDG